MKKLVSIVLCIVMVISMSSTALAITDVETVDGQFAATKLSDNMIILANDSAKGLIQAVEDDTEMRVTITRLDGNVDEGYLVYDKLDNTMYSSYTNKTFSLEDVISETEPGDRAVGDVVSRTTHKISYNTLANSVTPTSTEFGIASVIIGMIAALQGVTISTGASMFLLFISSPMWDDIREGLVNRSTKHGIKVVVAKVEIQKHQGGRVVKGYKYEIESVGTY